MLASELIRHRPEATGQSTEGDQASGAGLFGTPTLGQFYPLIFQQCPKYDRGRTELRSQSATRGEAAVFGPSEAGFLPREIAQLDGTSVSFWASKSTAPMLALGRVLPVAAAGAASAMGRTAVVGGATFNQDAVAGRLRSYVRLGRYSRRKSVSVLPSPAT